MLRDLVDEDPAIPHRPWVGPGGASAPGGATHGPVSREAWVRRDWLHVLVREREAVLESARLSGACSRRARLHNKALKLARSASRVRGHSACTSRPRPGILLAQLKAKDVRMDPSREGSAPESGLAGATGLSGAGGRPRRGRRRNPCAPHQSLQTSSYPWRRASILRRHRGPPRRTATSARP